MSERTSPESFDSLEMKSRPMEDAESFDSLEMESRFIGTVEEYDLPDTNFPNSSRHELFNKKQKRNQNFKKSSSRGIQRFLPNYTKDSTSLQDSSKQADDIPQTPAVPQLNENHS